MALNALRTEMVTFTGTPGFEANGVTVGYRAEYTQRTGTEAKYHAIEGRTSDVASDANHKGQYYIQLGEQLYDGKLKLNNNDQDVFGRPARKWEFDGKGIGTYAKKELLDKEYVGKVTGKDLYDLLGSTALKDYDTFCFVDGVYTDAKGAKAALGWTSDSNMGAYFNATDMDKNNKAAIGGTGTGVKTEVYVDHEADNIYVVVVNTYLAIASKDYDTKKEEASLNAYAMKKVGDELYKVPQRTATGSVVTLTLPVEDFPSATEIKKDDPLLVQVADGEVQNYKHAEVLSGVTVTSFKKNDNVVTGGTKYSYTTTADYKWADDINKSYTGGSGITNLKERSYNIYLDAYGNLIGIEEVEAKKNYVFITGIDLNGSNITNATADANAIFLDGTMDTIKINMTKSTLHVNRDSDDAILNTWCTFTKSGDVYTVKEVSDVGVTKIGGGFGDITKYPSSTNGNLAQFNQTDANNMAVGGKNIRMYGGGTSGTDKYYNVYGDSDTVYLTAELGELQNSAGNYGVIDDVVSVTTGVANTSLTAYNVTNAVTSADSSKITGNVVPDRCSNGIYGLYNDSGLIIAAVVVGEDAGTAKDLVYVHSSGLEEEIDNGSKNTRASNDDLWTWTRKVIRNGEEVLLTEVGDNYKTGSSLADMEQYKWYQVRSNADGNVTKTEEAASALTVYDGVATGSSQYVTNYSDINTAAEKSGVDIVLYLTNGGPDAAASNGFKRNLDIKGTNTLAVEGQTGSGIHFNDDVNVTLQYWNKNTKQTDIMAGEGVDDLRNMVNIVNDSNADRGDATYYVSALIQNGRATDIVIYDSYNNYERPGETEKPSATGNVVVAESFTGSKKPTMVGESKTTVNAFGIPVVSFNATVPAWAVGTVDFEYNLYVNDTIAVVGEDITGLTIDADQEVAVSNKILSIGTGVLKSSDSVRVEITDATYSHVKATYVDQDGNDISDKLTAASVAPATIATDRATGTSVELQVDTSKFGALGAATLTGLTGLTNTAEAGSVLQAADGSVDVKSAKVKLAKSGTTNNVAALGTGAVEVEITLAGATPKPITYSVTGQTTPDALNNVTLDDYPGFPAANTTDGAIKLTWTFTGATNVNAGSAAVVKVKAASALTQAYKYYLSGTIAGKEFKVELSASDASINISALNSDFEVKAADLTVTAIPKLAVTKASWDTNKAVFEFNCDVDKDTAEADTNWTLTDTSSGTAAIAFVEAAGNRVTVYFDGTVNAVDATDTLAITTNIEQDEESGNKTAVTTFTFKADGVVNNGTNDLPTA